MTKQAVADPCPPGTSPAQAAPKFELAQPLERRRLQAYLALMLGDIVAIFGGFVIIGYLYLSNLGLAQAALLAQLLIPVFLTVALYNGAYSLSTLRSAQQGMLRGLSALATSAAAVWCSLPITPSRARSFRGCCSRLVRCSRQ